MSPMHLAGVRDGDSKSSDDRARRGIERMFVEADP